MNLRYNKTMDVKASSSSWNKRDRAWSEIMVSTSCFGTPSWTHIVALETSNHSLLYMTVAFFDYDRICVYLIMYMYSFVVQYTTKSHENLNRCDILKKKLFSSCNCPHPYQKRPSLGISCPIWTVHEAGSFLLEFGMLSVLSGQPRFYHAAKRSLLAFWSTVARKFRFFFTIGWSWCFSERLAIRRTVFTGIRLDGIVKF